MSKSNEKVNLENDFELAEIVTDLAKLKEENEFQYGLIISYLKLRLFLFGTEELADHLFSGLQ